MAASTRGFDPEELRRAGFDVSRLGGGSGLLSPSNTLADMIHTRDVPPRGLRYFGPSS
jgi:hypothetical protein